MKSRREMTHSLWMLWCHSWFKYSLRKETRHFPFIVSFVNHIPLGIIYSSLMHPAVFMGPVWYRTITGSLWLWIALWPETGTYSFIFRSLVCGVGLITSLIWGFSCPSSAFKAFALVTCSWLPCLWLCPIRSHSVLIPERSMFFLNDFIFCFFWLGYCLQNFTFFLSFYEHVYLVIFL